LSFARFGYFFPVPAPDIIPPIWADPPGPASEAPLLVERARLEESPAEALAAVRFLGARLPPLPPMPPPPGPAAARLIHFALAGS
jgi:hypothetical protein